MSKVWPKAATTLLLVAAVAACAPSQPEPRSVLAFMEDGLARDGVLTRCNRNRDETVADVECANARRAAATLAIEEERARAGDLERQSERKLAAVRDRQGSPEGAGSANGAVFGEPVGRVMPSMAELEVYAEAEPLGRHNVEVEAATPPANDIEIFTPEIELADVAVIPRPFRTGDANAPR